MNGIFTWKRHKRTILEEYSRWLPKYEFEMLTEEKHEGLPHEHLEILPTMFLPNSLCFRNIIIISSPAAAIRLKDVLEHQT